MTNESLPGGPAELLSGFCSTLCNCIALYYMIFENFYIMISLELYLGKLSWSQNETGKWFSKHHELSCLDTEQISILANSSKSL